ncbi:MAG: hypothetical protein GTN62_07130 [Gemmatimonadales bacterium]|nr:hypothetical protein [Gemmatimonadales bacterium]NIN11272.1 hypothetical protein [Gemmatimonadales bacterium]NIN49871.1 hypothetical protein [Gemmatimonadales bacterium]NIP07335.1 hypothetical protein [Gemmatimonadales bacterium]NIR03030.1 hypothetical protein [Gemmatimonadales bacterium]
MMGPRTRALLLALGVGTALGAVLAQHSMGRHRRDLFSAHPLRRLSALGYLNGHPSVEAVRLLRDYLSWEQHPMLRRRAEGIVRRMEARLG